MLSATNVQSSPVAVGPHPSASQLSAWTDAQWIEAAVRVPSLLAELAIPLRCFHPSRGYFFACYLPDRGWYWAGGAGEVAPLRWALPLPRSPRRSLPPD